MFLAKSPDIRFRLLLLVILASLPGLLLLPAITQWQLKLHEQEAKENALGLAKQVIQTQKQQVESAKRLLQDLSQQSIVWQPGSQACSPKLATVLKQFPQYANLGFTNSNGEVICSALPLPGKVNLQDRYWFQQVIQTGDLTIGEFHYSPISQLPVLAIGYPILNSAGKVTGTVFASLNLEWLNHSLAQDFPPEAIASILDRQGVVLAYYPDSQTWVGTSLNNTALFQQMLTTQGYAIATAELKEISQEERLFALSRLKPEQPPDVYIAVGIPTSSIRAEANRVVIEKALWLGSILLLIAGLTWYIATTAIQRPIHALATTAKRISTGDFTARTKLSHNAGEFGQLAAAFDGMAAKLEEQIAYQASVQKDREVAEIQAQFVSMVSHEFRTPLTTIRVAIELLEQMGASISADRKRQYFDQVIKAVEQMTQMVEDVLLLGRVESGKMEFNPTMSNPARFCRNLLEELRAGIAQERTVVFSAQGDCAETLLDEQLLRSILINLLSNAIKYSLAESPVQLKLECQPNQLVFLIQDEGIGVPQADQERLFEAFQRASNVSKIPGTGLGLAIVKRCVDLHKGEISLESEEGSGTTFKVTLPRYSERN